MELRDRKRWTAYAAIIVLAALPRIWAAVWDQGIFWPDEIYQSTEQAHRFAFGYGYVSWEFQDGARSWLFPGGLGLLWKCLSWLGVDSAPALMISAKLAMVALALIGIYASMRIAEALGGPEAVVLCGALSAAFPPSIVYGSRCMSEMASGPLIALAVLLTLDPQRWKSAAAGCLAALVIFLRYQNGIITVGLLGWLLVQRRTRDAAAFAGAAMITGLAGGLLDLFTWGAPFHSFLTYVRFNLIEGRAADFGVEPAAYYGTVFWTAGGASMLAVIIGLCAAARRAAGPLVIVLVYVLAHVLVPHKELRFMMPIVPLMLALSSVGLTAVIRDLAARVTGRARVPPKRARRRGRDGRAATRTAQTERAALRVWVAVWGLSGVLAAAMLWRAAHATFDDFGQRTGAAPGTRSVWHDVEAVNRLLWTAGAQEDLCGLAMAGAAPIWTGGYSYLHRDVPIVWIEPIDDSATNYVLARADLPLPDRYAVVERIGEAQLARRPGACAPPPASYTRLFPK
jgi:hypothetical protein